MATSKAEIEKRLRRAMQRRTNAEQEIDELNEQLQASDFHGNVRKMLAELTKVGGLLSGSGITVMQQVDDNIGPKGGLSTVLRGKITNEGAVGNRELWFAINIYCDPESQNRMREQVLGASARHFGRVINEPLFDAPYDSDDFRF